MENKKSVLITGSSQGIGRSTALAFAREGYNVVVTYKRSKDLAHEVTRECQRYGVEALPLELVLPDDNSIANVHRTVLERFGRLSVLVNNAAVLAWKPFREQTLDEIVDQINTNVAGPIKMARTFYNDIDDTMINIASGAGKKPYKGSSVYGPTKCAMIGFTQQLAMEMNFPIYCINPGITATAMSGYKGLSPDKVASVILRVVRGDIKLENGGSLEVWNHVSKD